MPPTPDARAFFRLVFGTACGIAALGTGTAGLVHALERFGPPTDSGLGRWSAMVVAMASRLFLAAGVLRLARWRLVRDAHSVTAIASVWVLSEATVRSQVPAILTTLGVTSQLEAVAAAHRHQWLTPPT